MKVIEVIQNLKSFCCEIKDNVISLKKKQIIIIKYSKKKHADFLIWTETDYHIVKVLYDHDFCLWKIREIFHAIPVMVSHSKLDREEYIAFYFEDY